MNRANILIILLFANALALLNYHTSFSLRSVADLAFAPPQSETYKLQQHDANPTAKIHEYKSDASPPDTPRIDVETFFNFTIPEAPTSGRQARQRRNGTKYNSPLKGRNNGVQWWSYSDSCFSVDNICKISRNRWFYFHNSSINTSAIYGEWQPSFGLKHMPSTYPKGAYADTRIQMNVDASHRISWSSLMTTDCVVSNDPYHMVLQSLYNDMIGEWYSRTLMYLYKLLSIAPAIRQAIQELEALNMSNPMMELLDNRQPPIEETQYYVHITIDKKPLLDAHKLLLSGMHRVNNMKSTRWAMSAADLLWPKNNDTTCQCYQKLVFCGYDTYMQQNAKSEEKYTLWPAKYVDGTGDEIEGNSACNPVSPLFTMMPNGCQEYAKLKSYVLSNLEANYPEFEQAIEQHRRAILLKHRLIQHDYSGKTDEWSIVGLTQRHSRRMWLNLVDATESCNTIFKNQKVVCIEVNVEGTSTPYDQFTLHRSLDALIGVHGAQLTQAVLLPPGSHVLELLPWIPNYIQGGWTARTSRPTPLGVIFHNTDINHYGYSLNRSSVPLCEDVPPDDEKDCFMSAQNKQKFAWADRNFLVDANIVIQFVKTFVTHRNEWKCSNLQAESSFVLYNVWCKEEVEDVQANKTTLQVKHFYREK